MDFKKINGFTLIELVLVIFIIGILAVFASAQWPGTTINIDAQASQIANDIRYTQALSMTKGQRYRWVRSSSTTYQILDSTGNPIILTMGSTTATLGSGITFGTIANLPNNLVVFDALGVPYVDTGSPGTALTATATIQLVTTNSTETISITPETGRVSTT
jgi:prepilin-type N-terminal cleavage/methylation domain-containing protein